MNYEIDIYEVDQKNKSRFALGRLSEKTLFVFGVNPSTADDKEPDLTIKKVMGFAKRNGYTSFVMFNLYPLRATDPNNLPDTLDADLVRRNIKVISDMISRQKQSDVLLAWGGLIYSRNYLLNCWLDIYNALSNYSVNWLRIGDLLKIGQPRHPSRASYQLGLQQMDIDYFSKMKNKIN